ncbi:hypothetical protein LIER_38249 [Lithospermum erythrorhizon]|uniref:Uncharacterized protein n=1 Tax=Lithospermum erythrorhizon TaxID=34254 RepID=A0AAV3PX98_LITER
MVGGLKMSATMLRFTILWFRIRSLIIIMTGLQARTSMFRFNSLLSLRDSPVMYPRIIEVLGSPVSDQSPSIHEESSYCLKCIACEGDGRLAAAIGASGAIPLLLWSNSIAL